MTSDDVNSPIITFSHQKLKRVTYWTFGNYYCHHQHMTYIFLDKEPLPFPENLGLSDRAEDYQLPPVPLDIDISVWPRVIKDIRRLLPIELLSIFAEAVDTTECRDLEYVVSGWGAFARQLHDPESQALRKAVAEGRFEDLNAGPLSVIDRPLTAEEKRKREQRRAGNRIFIDGREAVWVEDNNE